MSSSWPLWITFRANLIKEFRINTHMIIIYEIQNGKLIWLLKECEVNYDIPSGLYLTYLTCPIELQKVARDTKVLKNVGHSTSMNFNAHLTPFMYITFLWNLGMFHVYNLPLKLRDGYFCSFFFHFYLHMTCGCWESKLTIRILLVVVLAALEETTSRRTYFSIV